MNNSKDKLSSHVERKEKKRKSTPRGLVSDLGALLHFFQPTIESHTRYFQLLCDLCITQVFIP